MMNYILSGQAATCPLSKKRKQSFLCMVRLIMIGFWLLLTLPTLAAATDTVLVAKKSQIEAVDPDTTKGQHMESANDTTRIKQKFTIIFRTNGGTAVPAITQDYGSPVVVPANPTRKGYIFMGWSREIPVTMPAENLIIWAKWQEIMPEPEQDPDPGLELTPM